MSGSRFSENTCYEFLIKGHFGADWSDWFDGLDLSTSYDSEGTPITRLAGLIEDQAALHSVLMKIRDLGLELISVDRLDKR